MLCARNGCKYIISCYKDKNGGKHYSFIKANVTCLLKFPPLTPQQTIAWKEVLKMLKTYIAMCLQSFS